MKKILKVFALLAEQSELDAEVAKEGDKLESLRGHLVRTLILSLYEGEVSMEEVERLGMALRVQKECIRRAKNKAQQNRAAVWSLLNSITSETKLSS